MVLGTLWVASSHAAERIVTVGVYENAPKIFSDDSGRPAGVFIDVIEHVARAEGWKLGYVSGTWSEGLDRLQRGEIDLMPDVAQTADREEIYDFHQVPVLSSWFQVYARKNSGIRTILDLAEKRIVVLERSVQQEAFTRLAEGFGLNATIIGLPDYRASFQKVATGEADAAITNRFYGIMHAKQYGLEDTAVIFNPSNLYFAAPRGRNASLLAAIDRHLETLRQDPQSLYYQSLKRWTSEEVKFSLPPWFRILALGVGLALILSLGVSLFLKARVNQRTRELEALNRTLRSEEQKYRELVMLANSIILRFDRQGRITFLNEFGQTFFGHSEDEIIGRNLMETLVPAQDSFGRPLGALLEEIFADPQKFERNVNENIRRNGERVWIDWRNKMVFDAHGEVREILAIGSDITDRIHAEEEIHRLNADLRRDAEILEQRVALRTAELAAAKERAEAADRLKSAFLATMSHELRTPLNSIIGFTGILLQGLAGPLNDEQQKQMRMVQNSSRHLLALINDVLDISKIEAGQLSLSPGPFDLPQALERTVKLVAPLAAKKGIGLELEIEPGVAGIVTDQRRLEQVFLNLLNNAVKFTEEGQVRVVCQAEADGYRVVVSDTGIGIREEEIAGLFQPFHQIDTGLARKHEGTGLGLSICRKLVDMMGGRIEVQSQWGRGSTFTVRIPRS
jgi:PAS domain S-box-containing protein